MRTIVALLLGSTLAITACSPVADDVNGQISESLAEHLIIDNLGDGSLEGHTPQGFAGSGIGLFAGDNLNANFPEGEGVQIFLAFPLPDDLETVASATLVSENLTVRGDPFGTLGALRADPVEFDAFGPPVFSVDAIGEGGACTTDGATEISCNVTAAASEAVAAGRDHLQFRLRFDTPGNGDGEQDLALFFRTDSNTNEPGIFSLIVEQTVRS